MATVNGKDNCLINMSGFNCRLNKDLKTGLITKTDKNA